MTALAELLVAIVAGFLELLVHLLAVGFSSSYLAAHSKGAMRVAFAVCAISGFHLFLGLVLPLLTNFQPYLLSSIFSRPVMLASVIILVSSLASTEAIKISVRPANTAAKEGPPVLLSYVLAIVIIIGLVSLWTTQTTRTTLRDRICAAATSGLSDPWKERGDRALTWAERLARRELDSGIPCLEGNPKP